MAGSINCLNNEQSRPVEHRQYLYTVITDQYQSARRYISGHRPKGYEMYELKPVVKKTTVAARTVFDETSNPCVNQVITLCLSLRHKDQKSCDVKVKIKVSLEQATKAQRGADVQLYCSFNLCARRGWVFNATPRPLYPRVRLGTHCKGGWVGPRAGLDGCGKSRPLPGFDPRNRPSRSESLYRLSYHGPTEKLRYTKQIWHIVQSERKNVIKSLDVNTALSSGAVLNSQLGFRLQPRCQ